MTSLPPRHPVLQAAIDIGAVAFGVSFACITAVGITASTFLLFFASL